MPARIRHITLDCHHPYALSRFWAEALGFVDHPDEPNLPDDPEAVIVDPKGLHPGLLFVPVPEAKATKNRIHLDIVPETTRDDEVARLLGLGATEVADHRRPDGTGWVVLADPEGNEFCVERSRAERGEPAPESTPDRAWGSMAQADEPELLTAMLEWYRVGVINKVRGTTKWTADAHPLSSSTSIGGLLKHLAIVEDWWFTVRFAGLGVPEVWREAEAAFDDDPDWEFHTAHHQTVDELLALYTEACDRSRRAILGHSPDDLAVDTSRDTYTLRFILVHMIEETARHLGHLDILRELLDGTTGD